MMNEGWPPETLALLTTGYLNAFYGEVPGFNGLERPAVVLAVNDPREDSRAKEMLYVGMSRARDRLVVCAAQATSNGTPEMAS